MPSKPLPLLMTLFFSVSLQGCSSANDLDRKRAEQLLMESRDYPIEIESRLTIQHSTASLPSAMKKQVDEKIAIAESSGLVNFSEYGEFKKWQRTVLVTDAGQPFLRSDIDCQPVVCKFKAYTYKVEFGEVTGISYNGESNSIALVEYTETYTPTPFGTLLEGLRPKNKQDSPARKQATFRLFDDGWRVSD